MLNNPIRLVKHGRNAEAAAVISALENKPFSDLEVKRTYHAIREAMDIEEGSRDLHGNNKAKTLRSPLRQLFIGGRSQNLRRASLGVIIQCFQQITGINLIT
jgi:hypothetical protein